MGSDNLYLIRGASTSNCPFFENESDCALFLELADRFLGDYVTITSFQNNRDGWAMIIKTKSAISIKAAYYARRAKSAKCKKEFEYKEVWRMLSDQVRIFLSTYVKATNYRSGRKGGKVRCRYERFLFETEAEAVAVRDSLAEEFYTQAQPRKRYRPIAKMCRLSRKMLRSSIYMSCFLLCLPGKLKELGVRCLDLKLMTKDVVRQLIARTLQHHLTAT